MPYVALDMLKEVLLDLVLFYYLKMYVSFRLLMENKNMPSLAQYRVLLFWLIHTSIEPLLANSGLLLDT